MVLTPEIVDFTKLVKKDFLTFLAPDLGVFVANRHGFQHDGSFIWNESTPINFPPGKEPTSVIPHQVYVRLLGGEALFEQRIFCWLIEPGAPPPIVSGVQENFLLGGGPPAPTDWVRFPVRRVETEYWFVGEHRRAGEAWSRNKGVGHSFDLYKNGTLSTVRWEDATDNDFNDLIMEVAVVFRRDHFLNFLPLKLTAVEMKTLERTVAVKRKACRG